MKKKLVVAMLALVLTVSACSSAPSNVAENTEVAESTEAAASVETEIATEEVVVNTEAETETESATEVEEATEVADSTEAEPEFAVVAMEATKYAKSSVNVRKGPSSDYEKIGSLSTNQKVKVIGQADTGWYQIELDGEVAYVSNNYLVDEKVAVNTTPSTNVGNNTTANTGSESNSDNGGTESDYVATTPDAGSDDVANGSAPEWTDEEIEDFWDDAEVIGGDSKPTTDGYGPGVEIEISPAP